MEAYNKKVLKAFTEQKHLGEIENPDGLGKVGNPVCGDLMWVYIRVKDNKVEDVKVKTFGCVAAIATSSFVAELAIGRTLEEAKQITNKDVAESLGGLPQIKMHCSNLAADGLRRAIEDYEKKHEK